MVDTQDNGQYLSLVEVLWNHNSFGRFTWACELAASDLSEALFVMWSESHPTFLRGEDFQVQDADMIARFGELEVWRPRPGASVRTSADAEFPMDERCLALCPDRQ